MNINDQPNNNQRNSRISDADHNSNPGQSAASVTTPPSNPGSQAVNTNLPQLSQYMRGGKGLGDDGIPRGHPYTMPWRMDYIKEDILPKDYMRYEMGSGEGRCDPISKAILLYFEEHEFVTHIQTF